MSLSMHEVDWITVFDSTIALLIAADADLAMLKSRR
jgi:hypothetical protein